ncbi:kinetochore-associated Ndc80 complex subunit spc24 [Schaereria dolodes]|nr:kinetochore-associated Ndc80 complex subunit spc24 [Schaereria dolodes]
MLLDEDPATLIHHTIGNFNIHPDKIAISRINESLSTLHQARDLRIREAESALKRLSRNLSTLSNQHSETLSTHSPGSHASQIVELDTQKFRIAKATSDLEIEGERLEQELEGLKGRLAELEAQGIEGDEDLRRGREGENETV